MTEMVKTNDYAVKYFFIKRRYILITEQKFFWKENQIFLKKEAENRKLK